MYNDCILRDYQLSLIAVYWLYKRGCDANGNELCGPTNLFNASYNEIHIKCLCL